MIDYLMHRINSTALPATDPDEKQSQHQISKAPAWKDSRVLDIQQWEIHKG